MSVKNRKEAQKIIKEAQHSADIKITNNNKKTDRETFQPIMFLKNRKGCQITTNSC